MCNFKPNLMINFMYTCFTTYFKPIFTYIKKVNELVSANDFDLYFKTVSIATIHQSLMTFYEKEYFGVSNFILMIVITTVLIDAFFGIKKSVKKSNENYRKANRLEEGVEKARLLRLAKGYEFSARKLQFTFFKCLTLVGYLFCANHIMGYQDNDTTMSEIMGFASGVAVKAPIVFFWYYDFKSIGRNIQYVYSKKPPIFVIVETIFEPRINAFMRTQKDESENN